MAIGKPLGYRAFMAKLRFDSQLADRLNQHAENGDEALAILEHSCERRW